MASASAEEESCDEKFISIAEEVSYTTHPIAESYAGLRDFLLVAVGLTAIASIFFLLTTFDVFPHFSSSFSYESVHRAQASCHDPPLRREWRALTEEEKMDFIGAVQCLAQKPSKLGLNTTRYDDFVYVHVNLYPETHNVAPSLPWHRYYIKIFENALQEECNFEGQLPYWDWTLDAAAPEDSPIWSVTDGFGGNGTGDSHCLEDGLLLDLKPQYPNKHCLQRDFIPGMVGFNYTSEKILDLWQNTTSYHDFRKQLESGPHKSVHNGIGGEMPTHGSSNDPIFFVHHAQIDRIWWHWQQLQPQQRLEDYFGPNNVSEPDALSQASLQDTLAMMGLDSDRAVARVMDTRSKLLCYQY